VSTRSSQRRPALKDRLRETACDAILDAAEEVAVERGLEAASIAAIAERAGVAVGTLYNYFPDRDGLLVALLRKRRAEIAPEMAAAAAAADELPFEARLRSYLHGFAAAFDKRLSYVRLAMALDQRGHRVHDREPTLLALFEGHVDDIFQAAEEAGSIPPGRHRIYAAMLTGSMRALKHANLDRDEPMDIDMLVDVFLHGAVVVDGGEKS
jgi:AcrR family transcriptional regulator